MSQTEEELKRIHGDDVELGADDSIDEKLTEEKALERAKSEGIEFYDEYIVIHITNLTEPIKDKDGKYLVFATESKAKEALAELEDPENYLVSQRRQRKPDHV